MPIDPIVVSRRFAEKGRIRLGQKGDRGQPQKLDRFRFTSTDAQLIADLALLYGGEPRPWDNNGKPEHEVITDATQIPVTVLKGGLSQWMEYWQGGGCIHRCTGGEGSINEVTGRPCDPTEQVETRIKRQTVLINPHTEAKPTTRIAVMLPELESLGTWRLESHGWNAAAEIPAMAELATFVGDLVPAFLGLQERRAVKDGRTSRFVVPVLDLRIGRQRLNQLVNARAGVGELEAPSGLRELEQGNAAAGGTQTTAVHAPTDQAGHDPYDAWEDSLAQAISRMGDHAASLDTIWRRMREANLVGQHAQPSPRLDAFIAAFRARAAEVPETADPWAQPSAPTAPEPDADGAVDAEWHEDPPVVTLDHRSEQPAPEPDADAIWQQILKTAGGIGMTTADVEDDFTQKMGGLTTGSATGAELQHYLTTHLAGYSQPTDADI